MIALDLFNREIVGWSLKPRMTTDIVTDVKEMLADPMVQEILTQIDTDEASEDYSAIETTLSAAGFKKIIHKHGAHCANVIFTRTPFKEAL